MPSRRYWDFDVARRVRFARQEDYLDAFRERFQIGRAHV